MRPLVAWFKRSPGERPRMPSLSRFSIRNILVGSFLLVILAMLLLASWSWLAVRETQHALQSLRQNELVLAQLITAANAAIRGWGLPTVNHIVENRVSEMARYEREMNAQHLCALGQLEELARLNQLPPRAQIVLRRTQDTLDRTAETHAEVVRLSAAGRKAEAAQLFRDRLKPALDDLEEQMGEFRDLRQALLESAVSAAERRLSAQAQCMVWMAAGAILFSGALTLLTVRRITRGVADVVAAARAVSRDVLDQEMSPVASEDEVTYLKNALAALRLALETNLAERDAVREQLCKFEADLAHAARVSTLGEMASGLAHELTQPLAAIASYTQACLARLGSAHSAPERLAPLLQKTASQTRRAGDIINRVRGFVRRQPEPRAALEIQLVVREALTLMDHELRRRRIPVEISGCETPHCVWGSRVELEQVLVNLVRNALQAMDTTPAPLLAIRILRPEEGKVAVAVADRGAGLGPGVGERIFEPFFTTKHDGLGMGLAISRSIVEAHGGCLTAEPNPGGGAVFRFTLPVHGECHAGG
jgi:signal transduction histidine kinase